jgi:cytoskeletal protein CcmA (bactofilin family)
MEQEKKPEESGAASTGQAAPEDALSKTNEQLAAEAPAGAAEEAQEPVKKLTGFKALLKKINLYLLLFLLVVVIGSAVSIVSYLNGKKTTPTPDLATQTLTAETLKQLANSDATVGDSGQTLTVQGNAIFSGQVLVRSDLNVAGTIKLGGELNIPQLTVSGKSNLQDVQANSLQVANASTFQGAVTVQRDLNVGGSASFSGPITAGQLTVTRLIMSGNAALQIPNHISFPGASPGRAFNGGILGAGGSASVNGSDTTGTLNVNTGSGTSAGCFITITFTRPFSATPHVIISPVGSGAGQMQYYVNRTTTSFSVCTANAAPANQVFAFDYFVTG